MRNKLFTFLVAFGLMIAGTASASLYNYFNGDLPSIQERTPLAEQCGIYDYAGTYEQNIALEDCLSGEGSDQMLGVTIPDVVALFEDNLGATLTKTATSSMTLVSGEDKEGNALSGTFGFIIDEGTTREEFIIATCAGTACTDLERGISVEDGKTTVVALQFKHRLGASIKMTNYPILGRMASVLKGTDSTGKGIFIIGDDTNSIKFDTTTTSIKYMYAWDSSSNPFLRYNGSNWQFSDDGVSSVNMVTGGGGLSASSTQGIQINSSEIGVIVSSTQGMYGGADGQGVYQKSKTDGGILKSSDGDYITTSSLVSAGVATSTPTADKIPIADGSGRITDWVDTQFGGDGSDGALTLADTTTTIDLTSSSTIVKNYTSISIDASSTLNFSNPKSTGSYTILKSQGDCTIAGDIDMTGMGVSGGTGGTTESANGVVGANSSLLLDDAAVYGDNGNGGGDGTGGEAGDAGVVFSDNKWFYTMISEDRLSRKTIIQFSGSSGGGGGAGDQANHGDGGDGGAGGGAILIQCKGALNFTGTIDVSGKDASDGPDVTSNATGGGGGGGGSAGTAIILYNSLTANTGTITASGGDGGDGGDGKNIGISNSNGAGGAGGAGSYTAAGGAGGAGDQSAGENGGNAGGAGAGGGGGGGGGANQSNFAGGTGGTGGASDTNLYLIAENNWF